MSWEDTARDDARAQRNEPIISIFGNRIHVNACFARMAHLQMISCPSLIAPPHLRRPFTVC